ncbi:MAG: inositol monophosphatase, partial [Holosporaceae bacterium]|nr:inositol monophosphatase [Holosporaceae bacterium]
ITVMTRAAIKASKWLLRDFYELENLQVSIKNNKDFMTSADLKANEILQEELLRARSTYSLLSEESEEIIGEDKLHKWIIDPLDGTMNYMHGFPHWAISIALEKSDDVIAAVTYDPVKNEMFWAEKGCGAYLNDKKIRVSGRRSMFDTLVSFEIAGNGASLKDAIASKVRKTGSTTLNMAYLAAGRLDVLYVDSTNLNKWDVAAGMLLIKEAGGVLADRSGNPINNYKELALMSNVDLLPLAAKLL